MLDLKPDLAFVEILRRLSTAAPAERARSLRLDRPELALLKTFTARETFLDDHALAMAVKELHVPITGLRPIEEAISSSGGIAWEALAPDLSLQGHPDMWVAGEMLDWDAPTGGFLLQASFALGNWAARGIRDRSGGTIRN
jgi:predicted flavoprotein YhiN